MPSFNSNPLSWFGKQVRNKNIFKQSISLTYKDKSHCINFFGGFSTFLVIGFIIFYGIRMMIRLQSRNDVQWNTNVIEVDSKTVNQTYSITENDNIEIIFQRYIPTLLYDDYNITFDDIDEIYKIHAFFYPNETAESLKLKLIP